MATPHSLCVMFTTPAMDETTAFYRDVLGFELKEKWPEAGPPKWVNLVLDDQAVMFSAVMSPEDVAAACGGDPGAAKYMETVRKELQENRPGVGVTVYVRVPDVDAFYKRVQEKGLSLPPPKTQFYGQRELPVEDPHGYRLVFYAPAPERRCASCGMPLAEADSEQRYCQYCTDEAGNLRSYEEVFEGTVRGYFMGMLKLPRAEAEEAARKHLARMPAWQGRS